MGGERKKKLARREITDTTFSNFAFMSDDRSANLIGPKFSKA